MGAEIVLRIKWALNISIPSTVYLNKKMQFDYVCLTLSDIKYLNPVMAGLASSIEVA